MKDSQRYINRELSWLAFNERVLSEAENSKNPILERIKFAAIFESNLDEFYMVRVSGLIEQAAAKVDVVTPDGLTADEQLRAIARIAAPLRRRASDVVHAKLLPSLKRAGVSVLSWDELSSEEQAKLGEKFDSDFFPLCTPLLLEPATTFPFISNRSLNLAVELLDEEELKLARVKIPDVFPRCTPVPNRPFSFILIEEVIAAHLDRLFPGVEIIGSHQFRVIRDADFEIKELEASDLISAVEETLKLRRLGDPVLLEVQDSLSPKWRQALMKGLELDEDDVFAVEGHLGIEFLWELAALDKPKHKHPAHVPFLVERLTFPGEIFQAIREKSFVLHHPYDSFRPVEAFVASVAKDPQVMGIKQTLYRVGAQSPLVESLLDGAEKGKQVAAMVELKARFDESNNLVWARALERAGVHVSYGFSQMKTHCKLCLVVRKEDAGIKSYVHIGTGNYNPATARLYTDIGLFTDDPAICQDVSELFNYLTGYSRQTKFRKLLVAPLNVREAIIERILREAEHAREAGSGKIIFKLNALVDPEVIDALYEASQAGVKVELYVRGICCLRPGVKGLSENIKVVSVVGRFLEHSRIYYFDNGGRPEAYIGSADMMRRNLDRRIEVLAPVENLEAIAYLRDVVLDSAGRDNVKAWELLPTGAYRRRRRRRGEAVNSSQEYLISKPAGVLVAQEHVKPTSSAAAG